MHIPNNKIYIYHNSNIYYPSEPPFHASNLFPEYHFGRDYVSKKENYIYEAIRQTIMGLGLDKLNYNTPHWNPFGDIIKPGNKVLIKPNMVNHIHPLKYTMDCLITHGSVIRAVCDYVIIALKGHGRITIGDAPIQGADFSKLTEINGISVLIEFYNRHFKNIAFELLDFRKTVAVVNNMGHITKVRTPKNIRFQSIDLGNQSMFKDVDHRKFRVSDYPGRLMEKYHNNGRHCYLVPDRLLEADVIINLPKPKTHKFAGITGAMKNFIGVNSIKENLPHFSRGSVHDNGDEYPKNHILKKIAEDISDIIAKMAYSNKYIASLPLYALRKFILIFIDKEKEIFKGMWYGNDTIWRTIVDINRIVYYADKGGTIKSEPQRIVFTIMDGIVAGEGQGPLKPEPKQTGVLISGFNPFAIDLALSALMKLNHHAIPLFSNCPVELGKLESGQVIINSNNEKWHRALLKDIVIENGFKPASGWEILFNNIP